MSATSDTTPIPEAVRERAAFWHVRLASDDADEADWLGFESWLAESPVHQRAYEAIEQVWSDLDDAPASATTNVAALPARPSRRGVMRMGAIAASLVATTVIGATIWSNMPRTQVFDTAPGQRQVVALADGTRITINGGSHLTAKLGRRERRVVMADAEAVFDVAKDPSRPFYIDAGEREIRVVGTEFNVLHQKGDVSVAVRRGVVEVRPAGAPNTKPLARLTKGQSLTHRKGRQADTVAAVDPDAALAWTGGRLVFQDAPLTEVAETLGRYAGHPIVVAPDARALRVTAVLNIGPEDAMLGSLSQFLPVRVERQTDSVRLSLRR
ncbi:FecR domain-containing protein [Phenylobacterium sp.]|uniref:FecR family protein n=1 Tax=Phenylobacterium sp. TaxID=1871053 RepID=UPI0025D878A6|nr:FecR domain-containing protein [Phenylobacterium sp.]